MCARFDLSCQGRLSCDWDENLQDVDESIPSAKRGIEAEDDEELQISPGWEFMMAFVSCYKMVEALQTMAPHWKPTQIMSYIKLQVKKVKVGMLKNWLG